MLCVAKLFEPWPTRPQPAPYFSIVFEFWLYALATHFHSPSIFRRRRTSVKSILPPQPSSRTRTTARVSSSSSTSMRVLKSSPAPTVSLSQQLREMEADGIASRKVYPVVPPKTEYALTDLGKATVTIVHEMDKWGADFFTQLGVPIPCDEE